VKDHDYMQNHAELETYLSAHPDVRDQLMANPQNFVQGARQFNNANPRGTSNGAGMTGGRGMSMTGSSTGTTGSATTAATSTKPAATPPQ
jgi:hypothetical protein